MLVLLGIELIVGDHIYLATEFCPRLLLTHADRDTGTIITRLIAMMLRYIMSVSLNQSCKFSRFRPREWEWRVIGQVELLVN